MTKMATIIAVKYLFLNQKANGLGTWYAALGVGPTRFAQMMNLG